MIGRVSPIFNRKVRFDFMLILWHRLYVQTANMLRCFDVTQVCMLRLAHPHRLPFSVTNTLHG